ncbi:MAG: hypothetical protein JXB49_30650 [Bacteroidales bacterium]|nr:hypothetical protein [Bacteroidales bacterium]
MRTIIHGKLFSTFIAQQPARIPVGDVYENERWTSFWSFLKSKADVILYGIDSLSEPDMIMLNNLTTGRGETTIQFIDNPISSYKNKVKCDEPLTFFCMDEASEFDQKKYREKNGYLFAFNNDILNVWERLSLIPLKLIYPIRKEVNNVEGFISWAKLGDYLTPFTDAVLVDNYILNDASLVPSNLEKILCELDKATPVPYNLTILTYLGDGNNRIDGDKAFESLREMKQRLNLKFKMELVLAPRTFKEHDRQIITNYIRIKSGDSFNYFNSHGSVITHGTEIVFGSLADVGERNSAFATLTDISEKIEKIKQNHADSVFGGCKNLLLLRKRTLGKLI